MIELPEHDTMELEHMDEEEKENKCKNLSDNNKEPGNPDPAECQGASAKEPECVTGSISFLPRNKEELERTIKNIPQVSLANIYRMDTIDVNID